MAFIIATDAYGVFRMVTTCTTQYDEQIETDWFDHYRTTHSTTVHPIVQAGGLLADVLGWLGVATSAQNAVKFNKSKYYWFERGYFIGLFTGRLTKMVLGTFFPKALIRPTKPWERYWDLVASEEVSLNEAGVEDDAATEDDEDVEDNTATEDDADVTDDAAVVTLTEKKAPKTDVALTDKKGLKK